MYYIQTYDGQGIILNHYLCKNPDDAHQKMVALCCMENPCVDWVRTFISGDPEPLVYAYRGGKSMRDLILVRGKSVMIH